MQTGGQLLSGVGRKLGRGVLDRSSLEKTKSLGCGSVSLAAGRGWCVVAAGVGGTSLLSEAGDEIPV